MQNKLFIDGRFVDAAAGGTIDVLNPHDGTLITAIAAAEAEDVDRAVAAAQRAFPAWSRMAAAERGRLLLKLADLIEANAEELAQLETLDTGHPIRDTRGLDVPRTAGCFRYFGGMADKLQGSVIPVEAGFLNYVQRAPIGVVGQIVPWNFPLMFTSWKLGPALAAGNTVVLKPSELTPLSTLRIAELMAQAGFPEGVVNMVPGYGHTAGQRLAEHPGVGKIAFTGSTATGRRIVQASQGNLKRVQLELGGKGANIVFDDANLDAAINGAAWAIFHNQGQACIAGSRLMLHDKIADAFLERFTALANSIRLGDPRSPDTEMGPLTSAQHRDKVLSYVGIAAEQGARLLAGGQAPGGELARGYYVAPTIVEARPQDRVAQEEVFGPFVTVLRFGSDEEALAIANATDYGLGSGLWTRDLARAHKMAGAIHAGMCWINCYKRVNPGSPFGGVGQSGYGREMGFEAMHDYTEARSVWVNVDAAVPPHFKR
ncbi:MULTISPECIES: aldehyde dehydrogenase family protein [Achromobacter]|jgi:betaine-aldehyde dehydrogenase|uniref:Aldehyde dehydrogenase family protein n=1 Tax=Achromobacter aegrifaciens TaxID=1287736 RepID=A0ABU2DAB9_ACHAE|nr:MULTISPECIES: aldehyde dehydrogenase family protein [Achromobacter]MBD9380806.1 aldehyde dehydrogenase family protein [Achromobacter sp. ACM02]MBD9419460.1 aldehyde dehydrogenase family protein [Achromobacter sp. ACM04]MBD9429851.1 aldehyde dehydrogenase family protein [Achromobacter sp. ACM03]MBD9476097.1 aldehyde dehydrogenase family protein [Achromobacter sp. ACM01]MDQ1762747.1 aldehyde dehydrogenase family protein [Achromobacter aegrifaciens]